MMSAIVKSNVKKADDALRNKIEIEGFPKRTITIGEFIFFLIGLLLIFFGGKVKIPDKLKLPVGLGVIFLGEVLF